MQHRLAVWLLVPALLAGCATARDPDPLEPMNRKLFAFNEAVDDAVLKPVASAYRSAVPAPVRTGVTRAFANARVPWSAINLVLQGRLKDSATAAGRFATNTTVGVLGLFDPAADWGMPRHEEDFGQTLGVWGLGTGAYLVLPLLGPSDLRDAAALPIDALGRPQTYIEDAALRNTLLLLEVVNRRANLLRAGSLIDDIALDKYSFVRDAYLQRRRSQVHDADDDGPGFAPGDASDGAATPVAP